MTTEDIQKLTPDDLKRLFAIFGWGYAGPEKAD
jgi:hypothetical protein